MLKINLLKCTSCLWKTSLLVVCWLYVLNASAQRKNQQQPPMSVSEEGKLIYRPDSLGNRIVDFSYSGYMAGNRPIDDVDIKIVVRNTSHDATSTIQSALDYVGSLQPDSLGFRGAVLLEKGVFHLEGTLMIRNSGVVLRGSGTDDKGTVLLGAGTGRETVVQFAGSKDLVRGNAVQVHDDYLPVNAMFMTLSDKHGLKKGDVIHIRRPSTKEWISTLGMEQFGGETAWLGWKPSQRDIIWQRNVVGVEGNKVLIDAPLTTSIEKRFGGATVSVIKDQGTILRCGIENLSIHSEYDQKNPKDEEHRWMGITFEHTRDAWVRQVNFKHLAGSAVAIYETAGRITVQDCKSTEPVSEIAGQRRYTFFTQGQQTLFERCYAENGYHDFAVGFCAAGPNAFVQCESVQPHSFSGAIDSWASGALFDNVHIDGHALSLKNRGQDGQGAGWSAANSVIWQCSASRVENFSPPTAINYAFGVWAEFAGNGYWDKNNEHIKPASLYYAQLAERLGSARKHQSYLIPKETEASSSPSPQQAGELTKKATEPMIQLKNWIDLASQRTAIPVNPDKNVKVAEFIQQATPVVNPSELTLTHGMLLHSGQILTGGRMDVPWWRGGVRPHDVAQARPHITRFVPGRIGHGYTDALAQVTDFMTKKNITVLDHNYGLWYDRRRDDHERIRRIDPNVWAPFYEQPFARSGQGTAFDQLSRYDLTKFNPWYWQRLREFAGIASHNGLVLYHQHYFQHNILEAGAHYADFPWRTANNINQTGFAEPAPYAGDKRIFLAEQFYDTTHEVRRRLHKAYIRQCLDNFQNAGSVIQFISAEYTGPLPFVQFWLGTIAEWETEKQSNALVALSTTKDVQDAILSDPKYASLVDVIDIRYWHQKSDGGFYAPAGGQNLAPRQHARIIKTGKVDFNSVYEAVAGYRQKYPDKAVLYSGNGAQEHGWAVLMAGGSIADIPVISDSTFKKKLPSMYLTKVIQPGQTYQLADPGNALLVYHRGIQPVHIDLPEFKSSVQVRRINGKTGLVEKKARVFKAQSGIHVDSASDEEVILWIIKK
jgi:hypothetical protein